MALDSFKTAFDNTYQDIFQKVLVGMKIANLRFEPVLKYGEAVQRALPDISAVRVRTVSRGSAATVDAITDTTETLSINLEKEAVFYISDGEVTQCGPLNPGEYFGGKIAVKVAADLDGRIFKEVINAGNTFDEGDLTTLASTATAFTLTATTVPQMVARMPAKLKAKENIILSNMAFVIDSYTAADISEYLLGKQFDVVESVFKNGYAGNISTAEVYVSENLTSTVNLTLTDIQGNGTEYIEINGIKIYFQSGTLVAGQLSYYTNKCKEDMLKMQFLIGE